MKKTIAIFLTTTAIASSVALPVNASNSIQVLVDNKVVEFPDAQPFLDDSSRTQVPARFVSEALGATVSWDSVSRKVTVIQGTKIVTLKIGEKAITVNGQTKQLDTAAVIKDGRTFVPLRFVIEALGAGVNWENATSTATISTNGKVSAGKTIETKGYLIPAGTSMLYLEADDNGDLEKEQYFMLDISKNNSEQQKLDFKAAITSKFGEQTGNEAYNCILPKKAKSDLLKETRIFAKSKNQYIEIWSKSGSHLIEIFVYYPGITPQ